jgi:hypothetical protein
VYNRKPLKADMLFAAARVLPRKLPVLSVTEEYDHA